MDAPPALSPAARELAGLASAPATGAAYQCDWRAWIDHVGSERAALAMDGCGDVALANYAATLAGEGAATATIRRRLAGVKAGYRDRGRAIDGRLAAQVLQGAARRRGAGGAAKAARPLTAALVAAVVDAMPRDAAGLRDRALLLVGWQGALRRGELAALRWRDIRPLGDGGATLTLWHSKGRVEAAEVPIVAADSAGRCPLAALRAWRERLRGDGLGGADAPCWPRVRAGESIGAAPIAPASVGRILKRRMAAAGLDCEGYSAHSLRAGLLTSAALAGASAWRLREHSRHKRTATLDMYIRDAAALAEHPAKGLL